MNDAFEGISLVQDVEDFSAAVSSGSWVEGGVAGLSLGLEALGTIANPADALLSAGVAWLMEHVSILTEALDQFAGDPAAIQAYAEQWRAQGADVFDASVDLRNYVNNDTTAWNGSSAEAYRTQAVQQLEGIETVSAISNSVADSVVAAAQLVGVVRMLVRDLIADCVAEVLTHLPIWLAASACSLGLSTPFVIADAALLIMKWV